MDLATIGAKELKKQGILKNLDESDEINACTVKIKVRCQRQGARTGCSSSRTRRTTTPRRSSPSAARPPASAVPSATRCPAAATSIRPCASPARATRSYPSAETLPGKLPQRKLVTTAAAGYSSYGNQIGLATGQVDEIYHPGYVAKRMEIGAVVGATPAAHVRRECPAPGDVVVLLGGRTGRDGIGGATGSSKAHNLESLDHCGAEVQKGNAPIERKLQRLFRNAKTPAR